MFKMQKILWLLKRPQRLPLAAAFKHDKQPEKEATGRGQSLFRKRAYCLCEDARVFLTRLCEAQLISYCSLLLSGAPASFGCMSLAVCCHAGT